MPREIKFTHLDFINAVFKLDYSLTADIAEEVGCDRRTALMRLRFLAARDLIKCEKRGPVWYWYENDDSSYDDYISVLTYIEYKKLEKLSLFQIENDKLEKFREQLLIDGEKRNESIKELIDFDVK